MCNKEEDQREWRKNEKKRIENERKMGVDKNGWGRCCLAKKCVEMSRKKNATKVCSIKLKQVFDRP